MVSEYCIWLCSFYIWNTNISHFQNGYVDNFTGFFFLSLFLDSCSSRIIILMERPKKVSNRVLAIFNFLPVSNACQMIIRHPSTPYTRNNIGTDVKKKQPIIVKSIQHSYRFAQNRIYCYQIKMSISKSMHNQFRRCRQKLTKGRVIKKIVDDHIIYRIERYFFSSLMYY